MDRVDTSLSSALVEDVNFSHEMAVHREQELRNLLKSIEELNSIFKDISILVIEQGTILDRIDYNIERAEHNVLQAEESLVVVSSHFAIIFCLYYTRYLFIILKAHERAKSSRTKQCMIVLCICVLGLLLVVMMKGFTKMI